jgi:Tfp pilus assembly protein PilX
MHTINPWSAPSHKTQIDMDGKRAGLATKRYETNSGAKPKGLSTDSSSMENGARN